MILPLFSASDSILNTIWYDNTSIARIIIVIIFLLLLASLYLFYKHWLRFGREEYGLFLVKKNLLQWRESKQFSETTFVDLDSNEIQEGEVDEDENPIEIKTEEDLEILHQAPIPLLMQGISKSLIIYDRLQTLEENKTAKARINVAVLQKLAELKEGKEWTAIFPRYVMTLSMLLGMLGTFIGLTIMVGDVAQSMEVISIKSSSATSLAEFNSSFKDINSTLNGVGTAFSTTLAGLTCTILVSFFNFFLNQRRASFFNKLEKFSVQDLIPSTFPDLEEKTMLETIEDQLEETFLNLNQTIEQNNNALGELNGLYNKFDTIEDTLKNVLLSGQNYNAQGVVKELNTVNNSLKIMIDKYQNKQFLDDFKNLTDHHKKYVNSLNGILSESKWIPQTKIFLVLITLLLGGLTTFTIISYFNL